MQTPDPNAKHCPRMQLFTIEYFFLLILATIFSHNYAMVLPYTVDSSFEDFSQNYSQMREESVHRGVLLSKSLDEQNKICHGILGPQNFIIKQIVWADEELERIPEMPRIHKSDDTVEINEVIMRGKTIAKEELFFICYGASDYTVTPLQVYPFYVFSAFETNIFHASWKFHWSNRNDEALEVFKKYANSSMPAKKIPLSQRDVEERYIGIRQIIDALRKESSRYIEMIEAKDDIRTLSNDERMTLCKCLLTTSDFQFRKIISDSDESRIYEFFHQRLQVSNSDYKNYKLSSENVLCRTLTADSEVQKDYYYTRSYNNKNSVFLIENRDLNLDSEANLYLESYFENIPLLINAKKR